MRLSVVVTMGALALPLPAAAFAQSADFSGKWLCNGLVLSGRAAFSFGQICDITQTGAQIAGLCKGPNGGGSLVGVVNGGAVDFTLQLTNTQNPKLSGVLTFHGKISPEGVYRGTALDSNLPGVTGQGAMMKL